MGTVPLENLSVEELSMYGTRDASNWGLDWQEHVQNWAFHLGSARKNLFRQVKAPSVRNDTWRRHRAHRDRQND